MERALSFSYAYLTLRTERGRPVYLKDLLSVLPLAAVITLPFLFIPNAPYFSKDGFLDKFSSFSGVLTGFYVAALIAVATLTSTTANLDGAIENGPVFFPKTSNRGEKALSRRQYVCLMFGYLAFLSVVLSLVSVLSVSITAAVKVRDFKLFELSGYTASIHLHAARAPIVCMISLTVSHMITTTLHGLYYLTDRLYARKPKMLPRSADDPKD